MSTIIRDYISPEDMLSESGEDLLKSGMLSDVKVKCENRVWQLHKTIICPRCPYFNKAFNGPFKEATTGEITIQDQIPDDIDKIVYFLYTGKVSQELVNTRPCDFFKLADFFQINSLAKEIISRTSLKLDGMAMRLRNMPQPHKNLQYVFGDEEIDYLFRTIETSYTLDSSPYARLKDLVKDFIVKSGFRITKYDRFLATLESIPELALDIMKLLQHSAIVNSPPPRCNRCRRKIGSDEQAYLWMTKDINRHALVRYELRGMCGDCQTSY